MTTLRLDEICRNFLIAIVIAFAFVIFIVTLTSHAPDAQLNNSAACSAQGALLDPRQKFDGVIVFGVASVFHQVLELTRVLQDEGIQAKEITSEETLNTSFNDILYILLAPQLVPSYPKHFIVYQIEQWGTRWITSPWGILQNNDRPSSYQQVMAAALEVWDYSRWNIQHFEYPDEPKLERCHVKYVPFAWFPAAFCEAQGDRDIDVLFFGAMNDKRQSKLMLLEELGINVTVVVVQEFELDAYVCRSKIVLNLHYYDGQLETSRIMQAISMNAMVISEPPIDPADIQDYSAAVVFEDEVAHIAHAILQHLGDDSLRHRRVSLAYQHCKKQYALKAWLGETYIGSMVH